MTTAQQPKISDAGRQALAAVLYNSMLVDVQSARRRDVHGGSHKVLMKAGLISYPPAQQYGPTRLTPAGVELLGEQAAAIGRDCLIKVRQHAATEAEQEAVDKARRRMNAASSNLKSECYRAENPHAYAPVGASYGAELRHLADELASARAIFDAAVAALAEARAAVPAPTDDDVAAFVAAAVQWPEGK